MTTRLQRQEILTRFAPNHLRGLRRDPCQASYLDVFSQADDEGINESVEAFISAIKHSADNLGYLLELTVAAGLFSVPMPRRLRCQQRVGLCKVPGDIWLDYKGRRFEFQCKCKTNWTVERWMRQATDKIVQSTTQSAPARSISLYPTTSGTESDWRKLGTWFIENYRQMSTGPMYEFVETTG